MICKCKFHSKTQTIFNFIIFNFQYVLCRVQGPYKSTIRNAVLKCESPDIKVFGPVYIAGSMFLAIGVFVDHKLHVEQNAHVTVGQRTTIKFNCKFFGTVTIGSSCNINVGTVLSNAELGNNVRTGWDCTINGGRIMDNGRIMAAATVNKGATVGINATLGERSTLQAGRTIGDGSCVGADLDVHADVPPGMIMNEPGHLEPISHGRTAYYRYGKCEIK